MDRDLNCERTVSSYRVLTESCIDRYATWQSALDHYYKQHITDESSHLHS